MIISQFDKHPDLNFKTFEYYDSLFPNHRVIFKCKVVDEVELINLGLSDAQFLTGATSDNFYPSVKRKNNFLQHFLL